MKFLSSVILTAILAGVGWHYMPDSMRGKILGLVGIAARGNGDEIKHFVEDVVLPKDPAERRAALTVELEKNIAELKRRIEAGNHETLAAESDASAGDASDEKIRAASTPEILAATDGMIKELESSNKDVSLGTRVTQRILDAVIPASHPAIQCPVK